MPKIWIGQTCLSLGSPTPRKFLFSILRQDYRLPSQAIFFRGTCYLLSESSCSSSSSITELKHFHGKKEKLTSFTKRKYLKWLRLGIQQLSVWTQSSPVYVNVTVFMEYGPHPADYVRILKSCHPSSHPLCLASVAHNAILCSCLWD
jgi:hypothetical protein